MTTSALAANAYAALSRIGDTAAGGGAAQHLGAATGGGGSFADMVREAVGSVAESGANADARMQAAAQGKGDLVDVVTAVAESELAIETLISVRDRVISAYEEIMRMPI